ncbi:type II toxin-antitoxin system PemK/MazF family toxin [Acidovorax sp. SRB_14]|uniref:type II toxin-antitoxin system PemK/MazF family toxin n=2 Tax=Acidovorax TaxID=12916 RepID=UPI00352C99AB
MSRYGLRMYAVYMTLGHMDREVALQIQSPLRVVRRGDIFWIAADETRGSFPGSPHPHVVVQEDVFNHSRISTVIVCALSSNLHKASEPGNVLLEPSEGDLERQSVVIASQVSCIYKARLGSYIGSLSEARIDQVVAGLRFVQAAFHRHG